MTEKTMEKTTNEVKKIDDNLIYVGRKPPMNYNLAVVTQFNGNGTKDIMLKIRGRSISTAVDTAEIVRNRFITNAKVKDITINTKSSANEDGKKQMFHQLKYVLQQLRKPEGEHNII
jgi:DNA-binding protein